VYGLGILTARNINVNLETVELVVVFDEGNRNRFSYAIAEACRGGFTDYFALVINRFITKWLGVNVIELDTDKQACRRFMANWQQGGFADEFAAPVESETETGLDRIQISIEVVTEGEKTLFDTHRTLCKNSRGLCARCNQSIVQRFRVVHLAAEFPAGFANIGQAHCMNRDAGNLCFATAEKAELVEFIGTEPGGNPCGIRPHQAQYGERFGLIAEIDLLARQQVAS